MMTTFTYQLDKVKSHRMYSFIHSLTYLKKYLSNGYEKHILLQVPKKQQQVKLSLGSQGADRQWGMTGTCEYTVWQVPIRTLKIIETE